MGGLVRVVMVAVLGFAVSGSGASVPIATAATSAVPLPFDQNEAVQIAQGYNGGTHQGASLYGLDLVLANDETSGATGLSPFDRSVPRAFPPSDKTGRLGALAGAGQFGPRRC